MATELTGVVPQMSIDYAYTVVNRALADVYRQSYWSFNTFEGNWTSPNWVQNGTVNVTQGSNLIYFDPLIATPVLSGIGFQPTPLTKRQFRIGVGTIYNIWGYASFSGTVNVIGTAVTWVSGSNFSAGLPNAWNGLTIAIGGNLFTIASVNSPIAMTLNSSAGTLTGAAYQLSGIVTLDRPYQEPSATGSAYTIFQCYYASPVKDFRGWAGDSGVRDMINYNDLYTNQNRSWIDRRDPQRTFYYIPTHVVYYQNDMNPASSTFGYPMFEIWGAPTYRITWQLWGYRNGQSLVNPADTIPNNIGEDLVMARARQYAYKFAESTWDGKRGRPNYLALIQNDEAEYRRLRNDYRRQDRSLYDAFHVKFRLGRTFPNQDPTYNSISGVATPGAP
jgi:hypothetical protein